MMPIKDNLGDLLKRLSNKAIKAVDAKAPDWKNRREYVEIGLGV